ncbi:hypothetical protein GCM10010082_27850 [Kushneria pakistanensis]|uniref:SMI1/KNR4 family protein n=1 Tax=Kushneria pakistanensis TaxID=1508770 RepID=A0ABQ3FPA9_9GAMM|nr:SMI1/KNR4 family protein [Kushneria pakistanensis]GHC31965.1 hypothetical protein GCM10010082_27850 [Kushneria pakistanensis]
MKAYLYDSPVLPDGFKLPKAYIDFAISSDSQDLLPWKIMAGDMAACLSYFGAMLLKFPNRPLVPFAIVHDESGVYNDGWIVLACFDGTDLSGDPPVRIYDYSRPKVFPWDEKPYQNFSAWLETAKNESSDYKSSLL